MRSETQSGEENNDQPRVYEWTERRRSRQKLLCKLKVRFEEIVEDDVKDGDHDRDQQACKVIDSDTPCRRWAPSSCRPSG
jgi:hypothetical protein